MDKDDDYQRAEVFEEIEMQSIRDADYLSQQSPRQESRDRLMTLVD